MSQIKNVAGPYQIFSAASMSGTATITSSVSSIKYTDNISVQFNWTGIPTGTFAIQGSIDYSPGVPQGGGPANPGNWNSITLSPVPTAAGSGSFTYLLDLNELSFPWLRAQYTNSSASGALTGYLFAKSVS